MQSTWSAREGTSHRAPRVTPAENLDFIAPRHRVDELPFPLPRPPTTHTGTLLSLLLRRAFRRFARRSCYSFLPLHFFPLFCTNLRVCLCVCVCVCVYMCMCVSIHAVIIAGFAERRDATRRCNGV